MNSNQLFNHPDTHELKHVTQRRVTPLRHMFLTPLKSLKNKLFVFGEISQKSHILRKVAKKQHAKKSVNKLLLLNF